jgi:hypothetical protein
VRLFSALTVLILRTGALISSQYSIVFIILFGIVRGITIHNADDMNFKFMVHKNDFFPASLDWNPLYRDVKSAYFYYNDKTGKLHVISKSGKQINIPEGINTFYSGLYAYSDGSVIARNEDYSKFYLLSDNLSSSEQVTLVSTASEKYALQTYKDADKNGTLIQFPNFIFHSKTQEKYFGQGFVIEERDYNKISASFSSFAILNNNFFVTGGKYSGANKRIEIHDLLTFEITKGLIENSEESYISSDFDYKYNPIYCTYKLNGKEIETKIFSKNWSEVTSASDRIYLLNQKYLVTRQGKFIYKFSGKGIRLCQDLSDMNFGNNVISYSIGRNSIVNLTYTADSSFLISNIHIFNLKSGRMKEIKTQGDTYVAKCGDFLAITDGNVVNFYNSDGKREDVLMIK